MADNKTLPPTGAGTANIVVATDEIAGVDYQYVKLVDGVADSTAKIGGDASNGLDVDVTRLPALVAGTANIGDVDVLTLPALPAGTNNIGDVDVLTVPANPFGANADAASASGSISAKLRLQANAVYVGDAAATATPTGKMEMGLAKAAAPTDVSADADAVAAWRLRNGAAATVITAAGALVGGDAANGLDVDVTRLPALVAGSANIGDVDVLTVPTDPFGANADAASATGSISAKLRFMAAAAATAPTATLSNVSGSASSVTLLASNAARKGATIWNDSTAILYVKLGATASATSCTVKLIADAYFEVPGGYTGIIDGIWASATGAARVSELT